MFAGFNREVRNSLRLMGLRIRYAVAVVEIAAEQYGAVVANNIDLLLTPRGTGVVRTAGNFQVGSGGTVYFEDTGGFIRRTASTGVMLFAPVNGSATFSLIGASVAQFGALGQASFTLNLLDAATGGTQGTFTIAGGTRGGNAGAGHIVRLIGGAGSTATTGTAGGRLDLLGGAANGTAANAGGDVRIAGGAPSSTGARGVVALGYDGTNVCRVTVRNTILGLNGYTSSAADPTTTDLATAGDFGIHKNTTSGTVYLAFNDGGTIKKVALA